MRVLLPFILLVAAVAGLRIAVPRVPTVRMTGPAFSGDDESISRDSDLVFACLDRDGDGMVSKEEMCDHLVRAGYPADVADAWFAETTGDGEISQQALRNAFLTYPALRITPGLGSNDLVIPEAIRMDATNVIFAADTSRDGEITYSELEAHMAKLGFPRETIEHVFTRVDLDENGKLDRDEMAEVFLKYSALRLALRER